ncbi:complement component C1q receptor-like [Heptranchias perlo]|uniref:complement component C1q receptor-like n=1 Tax=Heptranchias perlo TaxID=212740 RepID=UPI00355968DC
MLLLVLQILFAAVKGQLSVPSQTVCGSNACYTVHMDRKPFHKALESCKANGGNLVTAKDAEEALQIQMLLSSLPMAPSRSGKRKFWMGLQLSQRHCYQQHKPLRGFSWTSGGEETAYSNWGREPQSTCTAHRCVHIVSSSQGSRKGENFKWSDGVCNLGVDGYLCKFSFKGMCPKISLSGPGTVTYTTPFNTESSSLALVPFGSLAIVSCEDNGVSPSLPYVMCVEKSPKLYGWSMDGHFCAPPSGCNIDNGGCAQVCVSDGERDYHCQCNNGYQLGDDQHSCEPQDHCKGDPCEHRCVNLSVGFECICPVGYELAENERNCVDTDECAHRPCAQLCVNSAGSFRCDCTEGYTIIAGQCRDLDECSAYPCDHICQNTDGSYRCQCRAGYGINGSGHSCIDLDECLEHPCVGMCSNTEGSFECSCSEGYTLGEDHVSCVPQDVPTSLTATVQDLSTDTTAGDWSPTTPAAVIVDTSDLGTTVEFSETHAQPEMRGGPTTGEVSGQTDGAVADFSAGSWSPTPLLTVTQPSDTGGAPSHVKNDKGRAWLLACALGSVAAVLLVLCVVALILCRRHSSAKKKINSAGDYYSWVEAARSPSSRASGKITSADFNPSADKYIEIEANQTEV